MLQLPVDSFLEEILSSLCQHSKLVLSASPGAGKTTRLPPFLNKASSRKKLNIKENQKILVLEPRRIAAISAAQRIAEENNWTLGEEVGYQVRFDNCSSSKTQILFLTEALLAQKMVRDFELSDVGCVLLDEFHERSATTDLTLGLLKELQSIRQDLKIVVMSATLEQDRLKEYLNPCEIIEVPGRIFELESFYSSQPQPLICNDQFYDRLVNMIQNALSNKESEDILVFLPGQSEIHRTLNRAQEKIRASHIHFFPLHGQMSLDDQRQALAPLACGKKIVLATNVAESSITIDGVNTVIDCGLEKLASWNDKTDSMSLELKRISLSSAKQRAGRAARQKKGFAYRMWTAHDELSMPSFTTPQIHRSDLAQILMLLSAQGVSQFEKFDWLTPPDLSKLKRSHERLLNLELLTTEGNLSDIGKKIIQSPLAPDLGRLLYEFQVQGLFDVGCEIVALLQEKDFLNFQNSDLRSPETEELDCDLTYRWCVLNKNLDDRPHGRSISIPTIKLIEKTISQLYKMNWVDSPSKSMPQFQKLNIQNQQLEIQKVFLKAWPHRLCERRSDGKNLLSMGGKGFEISQRSFCRKSHFAILLKTYETEKSKDPICDLMMSIDEEMLTLALADKIKQNESLCYDEKNKKFKLIRKTVIGRLTLKSTDAADFDMSKLESLWPQFLKENFSEILKQNSDFLFFWQRLQFLLKNKNLLAATQQDLLTSFEISLEDILHEFYIQISWQEKSFDSILKKDLASFLNTLLPGEIRKILSELVPANLTSGKGKSFPISYETPEPTSEFKIQEAFGLKKHPAVFDGKIKIKLVLLAPNYRPAQITSDVISFWKTSYSDVRKELKARYPKHDWPEDPTVENAE